MDQLKTALQAVAKYSFWLICGVVVALSVAGWFLARSSLGKQLDANLGGITGKYQTVSTIQGKQNHPNDKTREGMQKLVAGLQQSVVNAWEAQYAHQSSILLWPAELGDDFVAAVRPLTPIEVKVPPPAPQTPELLKVDFRQRYANYVENLLPHLAEVIGAKWVAKAGTSGMPGMGMAPEMGMPEMGVGPMGPMPPGGAAKPGVPPEKPPVVLWSPTDQSQLLMNHFDWSGQPGQAPTTLQLLYAQEDLWVLRALVGIFRKANGDIESRHEAVVKTIESILIGRAAVGRAGQVMRLQTGSAGMPGMEGMGAGMYGPGGEGPGPMGEGGAAPGMGGPMPPGGEHMMPGAMPGTMPGTMGPGPMAPGMEGPGGMPGGMPGGRAVGDPANYRYVGNDYLPLTADKVRTAAKSENPEDAFYAVAKRMPIRLRLLVDQRKLHRLLTECGNSLLPVEIRQVRINRKGGGGAGDSFMTPSMGMPSGGYGGEMGAAPEMGGMAGFGGPMAGAPGFGGPGYGGPGYGGPEMGAMPGMNVGDMRGRVQVSSTSAYDLPVELYGIIYIYNPVDKTRLGLDQNAPVAATAAPGAPTTSG